MATPIWLRKATSHSSTPPSNAPPAAATVLPLRVARKLAVNPQTDIWSTGQ